MAAMVVHSPGAVNPERRAATGGARESGQVIANIVDRREPRCVSGPMLRASLLVVSLGFATLAVPARAQADCAAPDTAVAPRAGEIVPPDPVLHVFVPSWLVRKDRPRFEVVAGERVLPTEATQVSASDAFVTFRLAVETGSAGIIELRQDGHTLASYRVDPGWQRPEERFAVTGPERVVDAWTCSHTNIWALEATPAAAYRVTWDALERGTVVVPRDTADLFGGGDEIGRINLGHVSCLGATVPEDQLDTPIEVTIEPLYADGTAGPAWWGRLGAPEPPPRYSCGLAYTEPVPTMPAGSEGASEPRAGFLAWPVAAGLVATGLLLGGWLRRRRSRTWPATRAP
jgi:hypothetical protein